MGRFLLFIGAIILLGCHDPKKDYPIPNKKDINEIVRTVISQQTVVTRFDSTGMAITGKPGNTHFNSLDNFPLNIDLSRPWSADDLLLNRIDGENLFNQLRNAGFMKADSLYILFQCHLSKGIKIDTIKMPNTTFTSEAKINIIKKRGKREHFYCYYYQMSRPLFSLDQKQAYVMLDSYYNYMAAQGYAFSLKKINGKWKIIWQGITWMS